jgi:hypothetical protein
VYRQPGRTHPAIGQTGRSASTRLARRAAILLAAIALVLALAAPSAQAAFTRPFLRQLPGPPGAPFETGNGGGNVGGPGGIAVDAGDHLWVGDHLASAPFRLDEFDSSGNFLEAVELNSPEVDPDTPESLAIDRPSGDFFLTSRRQESGRYVEVFDQHGAFLRRWPIPAAVGNQPLVTVDNSGGSSQGTVYVAYQTQSGGGVIAKFDADGVAVPFSGSSSYLGGNQITGDELEATFVNNNFFGLAVDSHGDIFASARTKSSQGQPAILEYAPSGLLLRTITAGQIPEGNIFGLATAPNGDLVAALGAGANEGAVDEFDSSGRLLGQLTEAGGRPLSHHQEGPAPLAVDSQNDLYLAEQGRGLLGSEHAVDVFGPGSFEPGLRLGGVDATPGTATLNGEVNPEALLTPEPAESTITDCHFEYVTQVAFEATGFADLSSGGSAACVPAAAAIPIEPEAFHPVEAEITGLGSGTTYRYRLLGTTGGVHGGTATTAALAFTAPHAPLVESVGVENISSTFADLHARIDSLGAATTYRFEYLSQAEFLADGESFSGPDPATRLPVPDAAIGSGGSSGSVAASVLQHLGGLHPGTVYRFRVIAENEIGPTLGPEEAFSTLPEVVAGLPGGRAYELLTPPDKGSAEDMFGAPATNGEFFNHDDGLVADSGDQFMLLTKAAFGPFPASSTNAYVFSRTSTGWTTTSLASPALGVQTISPISTLYDPSDFSKVAFLDGVGSAVSEGGQRSTALLGSPGGPYTVLHADQPTFVTGVGQETKSGEETVLAGGSRDLGRVVLETRSPQLCPTPEAPDTGVHLLCEYTGEALAPLDLNDEGQLLSRCGAVLGSGAGQFGVAGISRGAVSADGSRALFTAPDPAAVGAGPGCWNGKASNAPQLYLRSAGTTIELSAAEEGAPEAAGHAPAQYVGASEDDSRVYFTSEAELTADDAGIHDRELYEWRSQATEGPGGPCGREQGCLVRISGGAAAQAGGVWTIPAVAADGAAVYFTAAGDLAPGAGAEPASCSDSASPSFADPATLCRLYRYDATAGSLRYIATVNAYDYPIGGAGCVGAGGQAHVEGPCGAANWYTTADGRYLLFATSQELTGYGTAPESTESCRNVPQTGGIGNGHCDELYRYDSAAGGSLTCVSCNPSGAPPLSSAIFDRSSSSNRADAPPRPISEDGSRVFFDTADPLVPEDSNGTLDVYEWEAQGTGACQAENGCISLISSGRDAHPSFFLGSSPDGTDVFFGTHARLVPQDTDGAGDLYDARIGGGFPPPTGAGGQCEGDACATPAPAPNDATPASLSFTGAGNAVSCPKGKVKQKGKCVAKHHKKKSHKKNHAHKRHKRAAKNHRRAGR